MICVPAETNKNLGLYPNSAHQLAVSRLGICKVGYQEYLMHQMAVKINDNVNTVPGIST